MPDDDNKAKIIAEALKALGEWIAGFEYKSIGGECPACHHSPILERHVGFVIGGHNQQSCPCRLIRQEKDPNFPCRCEWTHDDD